MSDVKMVEGGMDQRAKDLWELRDKYAALLARHNALEKDHNVSLMLLAREREQRDALLRLRDTDEWRSGVAIGGYIVSKAAAESELKTLKDRHNALREAVAWERETDECGEWLHIAWWDNPKIDLLDIWDIHHAARAEVDRMLEEK